ncbi:GDSL-like Lipase/Acylhydrolase [Rosistilla ulvae]|uniref:GDSL-like Lipase/Acylhydrolase n=1 Tax=Rosistilla ulvae TaxID=1930277 RepID=A0A517LXT9_9BACT|nr:GDSL-type esterase/lipase family protein [Rosistilla ulvae]QDS87444.1 GDSL-like Lipase/Acylhydrolase [Rosistilla ulvae]
MSCRLLLSLACWMLCAAAPSCLVADGPLKIMAVGDSITQGGGGFSCYREYLLPMLSQSGASVQFVGPQQDATSRHCGFGGKNTAYLNRIAERVAREYPADIVLLHSGHNSFSRDKPIAGIIRATEQMLATLHEINPEVIVLVAQVIPSGKLPKYAYIPELNEEIARSVDRMRERGIDVYLVNQAAGFDWTTDTVADRVHPNSSGAKKMAQRWLQTLQPLLARTHATAPGETEGN